MRYNPDYLAFLLRFAFFDFKRLRERTVLHIYEWLHEWFSHTVHTV